MAWPKGQPRKGHMNKDGTPHAPRGSLLTKASSKATGTTTNEAARYGRPRGKRTTVASTKPVLDQTVSSGTPEVTTPTLHGANFRPVIETCPNCGYAYADGGYCPDCGWSKVAVPGRVY